MKPPTQELFDKFLDYFVLMMIAAMSLGALELILWFGARCILDILDRI